MWILEKVAKQIQPFLNLRGKNIISIMISKLLHEILCLQELAACRTESWQSQPLQRWSHNSLLVSCLLSCNNLPPTANMSHNAHLNSCDLCWRSAAFPGAPNPWELEGSMISPLSPHRVVLWAPTSPCHSAIQQISALHTYYQDKCFAPARVVFTP